MAGCDSREAVTRCHSRQHSNPDLSVSAGGFNPLTSQPAGLVGCEEDGNRRDVFGFAESSKRSVCGLFVFSKSLPTTPMRSAPFSCDASRCNRVNSDTSRSEFLRKAPGNRIESALCSRVHYGIRDRTAAYN